MLADSMDAPFHDWQSQVRFLRGNLERGRDNFIAIHGPEGHRKSTTGMNYATTLKPTFDPDRDVIWDTRSLLDLIKREVKSPSPPVERVWYVDEGANLFFNRDWQSIENKGATKLIRKTRVIGGTWITCLPDFEALDLYLREHRVTTRVYCPPYYDAGGASVGPASVYWRQERFDPEQQRVVHWWKYVYPLAVKRLDGTPAWDRYNQRKVEDIMDEVRSVEAQLRRREKRSAKEEGDD